jgi:cobalt/nickel transport system permease protein
MWTVTAAATVYCSRKIQQEMDDGKVPLMGVLGAFIFAAQMINFTIPGTGSSGHLGGGLILAVLLGPHAAFLVMASVLTVQALFFADGGLLALGANIFILGFIPCFLAYPFVYQPLAGNGRKQGRRLSAALAAAVAGLQLGSFGVVLQTVLSGISELPFTSFLMLMQPIHLAIGIVEGLATAALISSVRQAQPEILPPHMHPDQPQKTHPGKVLVALAATALVTGAAFSWFASTQPDGLEWSIARLTGTEELRHSAGNIHQNLARLQGITSFLPDYGFRSVAEANATPEPLSSRPTVDPGSSVSGVLGGLLTLLMVSGAGWLLRRRG